MSYLRSFVETFGLYKAYKKMKDSEDKAILLVGSSVEELDELSYVVSGNKAEDKFTLAYFDEIAELSMETVERIKRAKAVVIYSKKPVARAGDLAVAVYAVSKLNLNWSLVLFGEDSQIAKKVILEVLNIPKKRVYAVETREAFFEITVPAFLSAVPLEDYTALEGLELIKEQLRKDLFIIVPKVIAKSLSLYAVFGKVAIPFLVKGFQVSCRLLRDLKFERNENVVSAIISGAFLLGFIFQHHRSLIKRLLYGSMFPAVALAVIISFPIERMLEGIQENRNEEKFS